MPDLFSKMKKKKWNIKTSQADMYLDLLGEPATIICSKKEVTGSNQLAFFSIMCFPVSFHQPVITSSCCYKWKLNNNISLGDIHNKTEKTRPKMR